MADSSSDDPERVYPPPARPSQRWRMPRAVAALVLREMSSTYGRSPGGYLWAVVEPIGGVIILTVVFSVLLRSPSLGVSFPLFYATGLLPFGMFTQQSNRVGAAMSYSRALLFYPGVTFVDALLARFLLALVTNFLVAALVLFGIIEVFSLQVTLDLPVLALAMVLAAILGAGVGTLNAYLTMALPVWERIWVILTRPLFLLSGLLYLYEELPRVARDILWWNPIFHVIGLMRAGTYSSYDATYASSLYVLAVSVVLMLLGMILLHRFHRDLLQA